jgi:tight adherence protein B
MDALMLVAIIGWPTVVALFAGARRCAVRRRVARAVGVGDLVTAASALEGLSARFRRRRRVIDDLPEILDELARALRANLSLRQALLALPDRGALAGATARLRHELDLGRPIPEAVTTWIERLEDPLADLAGAALSVAIETGGAGAVAVDRVAATVRDRRAIQLEAAAQASQARASALVIGLLPVGFLGLATSADPASTGFLLGTRLGLLCLGGGLALDALGIWWMHRITTGVRW